MKKLFLLTLIPRASAYYLNATLTSMGGDLSVTVYLPRSISPNEAVYYESSRFEHGSMIGNIRRIVRDPSGNPTAIHTLYGTDLWRVPHEPRWPESGVGLASEFGVGDDGPLCTYRCGWNGASSVSNGLLGYKEARNGEPFIKIGVGILEKGTCLDCDIFENYHFNSPYKFAEDPVWTLQKNTTTSIVLENKAVLHSKSLFGYGLRKEISLQDNILSVKSTLTNLGEEAFTTPWYSHHFFSCDGQSIGPGYNVEVGLKPPSSGNMGSLYEEPGLMWWSSPLRDYAKLVNRNETVEVQITRAVDAGKRIKAEFVKDETTHGMFILKGCGTAVKEEIPEVSDPASGIEMYAFNLYIEQGTLSPEPLLLLHLEPGKSLSWTQRLEIQNLPPPTPALPTPILSASFIKGGDVSSLLRHFRPNNHFLSISIIMGMIIGLAVNLRRSYQRRNNYLVISDVQIG